MEIGDWGTVIRIWDWGFGNGIGDLRLRFENGDFG